jgi:hypothetical protein
MKRAITGLLSLSVAASVLMTAATSAAEYRYYKVSPGVCRKVSGGVTPFWGGIKNASTTSRAMVECPIQAPSGSGWQVEKWYADVVSGYDYYSGNGVQCSMNSISFAGYGVYGWVDWDSVPAGNGEVRLKNNNLMKPVNENTYLFCNLGDSQESNPTGLLTFHVGFYLD